MNLQPTQSSVDRETPVRYREVRIGSAPARVRRDGDVWYMESAAMPGNYPQRLTDRLASGARAHPDRWLVARRGANGEWQGISYAQMLQDRKSVV